MKLKNIHTRKDFLKVYELVGGTAGGTSANNGFANDVAMKDSVLGKMINGMFRGVSWLWRKSKENFVINKLIAQLVNELMRGVILFCFANNIKLSDGTTETKAEEIEGNKGETTGNEINPEALSGSTISGSTETVVVPETPEQEKIHIQKLVERIEKVETKEEYIIIKKEADERIKADNEKIIALRKKAGEYYKNKVAKPSEEKIWGDKIYKVNSAINKKTNYINLIKQALDLKAIKLGLKDAPYEPEKKVSYNIIAKDLEDFYPQSENIPERLKEFNSNILPYNKIDTTNTTIKQIMKDATEFLDKYAREYENLTDEQKKQVQLIYMQYAIIQAALNHKLKESYDFDDDIVDFIIENFDNFDFLSEENIATAIGQKVATAGTAKVTPDDPRAGKVSVGRSAAMKIGGATATVGDILTKRDRKKYKDEHEEDFKLDIHSVDLGGIETTISKMQESSSKDIKTDVSSFVNPYSLKMIQLSADNLLIPPKNKEGVAEDNTKLKIKWNKEVNKIYASFTNIMNISKVDITKDDYKSELNNNNEVLKNSSNNTDDTRNQMSAGEVASNFPIENAVAAQASNIIGNYCLFQFSVASNKKLMFHTSISAVADFKGLINITQSFLPDQITDNPPSVVEDSKFWNSYSKNFGGVNRVYFLMKADQGFPKTSNNVPASIYVVLENLKSNIRTLHIKVANSQNWEKFDDNLLKNFNKDRFLHKIAIVSVSNFDKNKISTWETVLKIDKTNSDTRNLFVSGNPPIFLKDTNIQNNFITLQKSISK